MLLPFQPHQTQLSVSLPGKLIQGDQPLRQLILQPGHFEAIKCHILFIGSDETVLDQVTVIRDRFLMDAVPDLFLPYVCVFMLLRVSPLKFRFSAPCALRSSVS